MKLLETYNISISKIKKQDGTTVNYAYIDPAKSTDNTMNIKDGIKQYGANWNKAYGVWGWYLSPDPAKLQAQLEKMVYPAIEYLNSQETTPEGQDPRTADQMKQEFQELLSQIDETLNTPILKPVEHTAPLMDERTLKSKLEQFKEELVNAMTNEEFLQKLEPIIKFRNAQGHQLSFLNALLIWIQNPQAKLVKARSTWAEIYNRNVKPDAKALAVWYPVTINRDRNVSRSDIKRKVDLETANFLKSIGKTSEAELTPGEKDKLRVIQNSARQSSSGGMKVFRFRYCYYDVSDTVQIEGKDDVVGSMQGLDDIEWTDNTSEPTELTVNIYDAMCQIIQEAGIKLNYVNDLGGAMGVSKSGTIDVLSNSNKNAGAASTLIHEFSHELLHQKYLKSVQEGKGEWAKYFIGTQQGRGVVEQQAELCAYLVLRFFNIKLTQNINYIAIWGADANKACIVFDTVASVANDIASAIAKKLNMTTLNEDGSENQFITGLDVAELLGQDAVNVYNNSKQQMFNTIRESFNRYYERISGPLF